MISEGSKRVTMVQAALQSGSASSKQVKKKNLTQRNFYNTGSIRPNQTMSSLGATRSDKHGDDFFSQQPEAIAEAD